MPNIHLKHSLLQNLLSTHKEAYTDMHQNECSTSSMKVVGKIQCTRQY